jgi:hypothetical protein
MSKDEKIEKRWVCERIYNSNLRRICQKKESRGKNEERGTKL